MSVHHLKVFERIFSRMVYFSIITKHTLNIFRKTKAVNRFSSASYLVAKAHTFCSCSVFSFLPKQKSINYCFYLSHWVLVVNLFLGQFSIERCNKLHRFNQSVSVLIAYLFSSWKFCLRLFAQFRNIY